MRGGGMGGLGTGRAPSFRSLGSTRPAAEYGGTHSSKGVLRPRTLRERAFAQNSVLRHTDWVLVATVLALALIGTLLVWSATQPELEQAGANPRTYLEKQLLNVFIGLILMVAVSALDYRMVRIYAPFVYAAACLGLLAVLSPLGSTVNGAHAWISLPGGFQIEPSEYAKLGLILLIAMVFGETRSRASPPTLRQLLAVIALAAPVLGLVVAEPALGVTIVLLTVVVGMIVLSGLPLRWIGALAAAGTVGAFAVLSMHVLKPYQVDRLTSFMNPSANPLGSGYSAAQAKIAIGSGGMFGQGLFHGQLVAGSFVPSQQTDFIFTVAGEELGFVGAVAIVVLLGVVIFRALRIAARADDMFGLLVASGIAVWFGVQVFINIGMTIGIAPVTGLPLPFVSYGGSAMFADMIAIGVLQAVHRRHRVFS
jgi:rod shape determining protein RodA